MAVPEALFDEISRPQSTSDDGQPPASVTLSRLGSCTTVWREWQALHSVA
jgi:hypothetical protein